MAQASEIRYLTPPTVDVKKKKYCRFKKSGIKYIDYKDPEFLKKFLNEQGKILHVFDKFKTGEHHQVVLDYLHSL